NDRALAWTARHRRARTGLRRTGRRMHPANPVQSSTGRLRGSRAAARLHARALSLPPVALTVPPIENRGGYSNRARYQRTQATPTAAGGGRDHDLNQASFDRDHIPGHSRQARFGPGVKRRFDNLVAAANTRDITPAIPSDPVKAAAVAGLRYVGDHLPGIRRERPAK